MRAPLRALATAVLWLGACDSAPPTPPDPVTLLAPITTIEVGGNVQLSLLNARGPVTWASSNTAVATVVSTGFVTAVGPGTTTITAATATQSANVTLTVSAPPLLVLGASIVEFTGRVLGANPAPRAVALGNGGSGTLSGLAIAGIEYEGTASDWLAASLSATTASAAQPAQLQLAPSVGALPAGSHVARVAVTAADGAGVRQVVVTLTLAPPPTLVLSRESIAFTLQAGSQILDPTLVAITAGLTGDTLTGLTSSVVYDAGGPTGWLTRTVSADRTPASSGVTVSAVGLTPGSYGASLLIASPQAANGPQSVRVTMNVTAPPHLVLSANTASFSTAVGGANPLPVAIGISNGGGGTLTLGGVSVEYAAGQPTGWLATALASSTAPSTLTLSPTTGSLAPGTYTANVRIVSPVADNSPRTIAVTLVVSSTPVIALSRSTVAVTLTAGGIAPTELVSVTNGGGGVLSGLARAITYSSGSGWLTATLNTSTAPATLSLVASSLSLTPGTYSATVSITSPVATNSPRTVDVTFTVTPPPPSIALSATTRSFTAPNGGGNPTSQTVTITNGGGGSLTGIARTVTYGSGSGWLNTALNTTTAPATLTLSPVTGSLAAGTYTATVAVSASGAANSPQNITVTFVVPSAAIGLSTTSTTFTRTSGSGSGSSTVIITNVGAGTLTLSPSPPSISYSSGLGWLSASYSTTSVTTGSSTLTLTANAGTAGAPLAPGTYTATVTVASPTATNRTITVTFDVQVSLSLNIWPTLGPSCTGCHFSGGSLPALTSASQFRTNTVGVFATGSAATYPRILVNPRRIVAGSATQSYLMDQLNWTTGAHRMPTGTQLGTAIRSLISTWINQGALNN